MDSNPCWPPTLVDFTELALADSSSCNVFIFSLVGSPSCLGMLGWGKLSMYVSTVMVFILDVSCNCLDYGVWLLVLVVLIMIWLLVLVDSILE